MSWDFKIKVPINKAESIMHSYLWLHLRVHKERAARTKVCKSVKLETSRNLLPILKIATHTAHAAWQKPLLSRWKKYPLWLSVIAQWRRKDFLNGGAQFETTHRVVSNLYSNLWKLGGAHAPSASRFLRLCSYHQNCTWWAETGVSHILGVFAEKKRLSHDVSSQYTSTTKEERWLLVVIAFYTL